MSKNDQTNWDKDVNDLVKNIMDSIDLKDIKKNIKDTMVDLETVVKNQTKNIQNQTRNQMTNINHNVNIQTQPRRDIPVYKPAPRLNKDPMLRNIPGQVAGVLFTVFGGLGVATFLTLMTVFMAIGWSVGFTVFLPLFIICSFIMGYGITMNARVSRFKRYVKAIQGRAFCKIRELSAFIRKPETLVLKDLKKMIATKMFPEGHIDYEKTHLILTDATYSQYLATYDSMQMQLEGEKQQTIEQKSGKPKPKSETDQVISTGCEFIRQIKDANVVLKGEGITQKLNRLESVTTKIFLFVERNPHKLSEIRKFMDYYLPTTLKLVLAYKEFEGHSFEGDNIVSAKKEIEQTLDTINTAFENLFDSMFEDAALDISTDISVLETMLVQEGLTKQGFHEESKNT